MTEPGILLYDLARGNFCEECGRPKLNRLMDYLTGCPACDEVVTRHRCTERPDRTAVTAGTEWVCPQCASVWVASEETDWCGECGSPAVRQCWDIAEDRRTQGPRREPKRYTPPRLSLWPRPAFMDARLAEEQDRRDWLAGIVERLGLVLMDDAG